MKHKGERTDSTSTEKKKPDERIPNLILTFLSENRWIKPLYKPLTLTF